jgi:O-antigen ligase
MIGSAVFGISLGGSLSYIATFYWKVLVLFAMLLISVRDVKDLAFILWAFVISIGTLVVLANTGMISFATTFGGLARLDAEGMYDANDLGMILLMGLPLGFLFLFNSGRLGKVLSFLVIAGVPATIALTGSRGAFVGLAVVMPLLFLANARVSLVKRLGTVGIILAALTVAAPAGYWEQMETIIKPEADYNRTEQYGRVEISKRGIGYMSDRPIFGVGINNFARAEGTISSIAQTAFADQTVKWVAPHNTYVQLGAETGVFGLLIWLALQGGGTVGLLRLRRRIPISWEMESTNRRFLREVCLFLPISFVAFAVTSFFLSHAYTAPFYFLLVFLSATYILVHREFAIDAAKELQLRGGPGWGPGMPIPKGPGVGAGWGGNPDAEPYVPPVLPHGFPPVR